MDWTHEKGGRRGVEQGGGAGGKAKEKVKKVCDERYEFVGNRRAYGTRLPVVESSHCPSNPTLNGKMWTLNENDDDELTRCE
ncbi:hypothetical protein E2C01_021212 [Portunus trituberculatus]|uniref:Uncharacterized protein n=1 Tax=Portunus trituberculatus TaxID=210409 RepID=A0A5B7E3M0_PORTR|nr:hypothetical protein [Portunus trituberculatus]